MKNKKAGRPKMSDEDFLKKSAAVQVLRDSGKFTTMQIAEIMGYTSRQAIARYSDKTKCGLCGQPLPPNKIQKGN